MFHVYPHYMWEGGREEGREGGRRDGGRVGGRGEMTDHKIIIITN
jgi:hypothetical protein